VDIEEDLISTCTHIHLYLYPLEHSYSLQQQVLELDSATASVRYMGLQEWFDFIWGVRVPPLDAPSASVEGGNRCTAISTNPWDLPSELVDNIHAYLPPCCSHLTAMACVCREAHIEVTRSHLWRVVDLPETCAVARLNILDREADLLRRDATATAAAAAAPQQHVDEPEAPTAIYLNVLTYLYGQGNIVCSTATRAPLLS
jgi:hypothetical protein